MQISSQLVPTGARGVVSGTRRRDDCPGYVLPRVRELPLRLEPVIADGFGGLVASRPAPCAVSTTTTPRGSLLMMFVSTRRIVAAIVAAACVAVPAAASADALPSTYNSDAAQSGWAGSLASTDRSGAAQSGSTAGNQAGARVAYPPVKDPRQADMHASTVKKPTFPLADFRGGDTPVDHPGASRAVTPAPTTIEVVGPARTIVRDVDEALPIALSATALLLVLAMIGITLARTRLVPRPGRGH